jgi:hypothetical protein
MIGTKVGGDKMKATLEHAITLPMDQQFQFMKDQGYTIKDLCETLLSKDDKLRNELVPFLFVNSIQSQSIDRDELKEIVTTLVSDAYLFYKIGSRDDATVFVRSNTALWLTIIFQSNEAQSFLSEEEAIRLFEKMTTYLMKEKDLRGYVEPIGWANAVTNAMNLYIILTKDASFQLRFIPTILTGMTKTIQSGYVFVDDEEAKFAHFIQALVSFDYPEEILIEWIEQLYDRLQFQIYEEGYTPFFYKGKTNLTHTMQALYFKLKFSRTYPKVQATVSIFLSKWA